MRPRAIAAALLAAVLLAGVATRAEARTIYRCVRHGSVVGLGRLGPAQLDRYPTQFKAAARATGVDEAWLRAIAHAESGFDARALSPKGAQGVMQLMPALARTYGVRDPYAPGQSIEGGAR